MKILRVIHSADPQAGGPIHAIDQVTPLLAREGIETTLVSLDPPGTAFWKDSPMTMHALGPGKGFYGYTPRWVPWLRENAPAHDLVIIHGIWQYQSFGTWRALHGLKVPYVAYAHGMLDPWFRRTYPLKHFKKWLYWPWADYRVLRDARAVWFTTDAERRLARQSFSLYRCRERVVPYGVQAPKCDGTEAAAFRAGHPELGDKPFLLFLGRIHEKKGVDLLLKAYAESPLRKRARLVIAGPVADQRHRKLLDQYRQKADVCWLETLSGSEKWGALAAAEALVLPSHQENFGMVVAEALAMGTPVLTTHPVNTSPTIAGERCGLVDEDTLQGVWNLLRRWEDADTTARSEIASRTRPAFERHFDIERRGAELAGLLREAAFRT